MVTAAAASARMNCKGAALEAGTLMKETVLLVLSRGQTAGNRISKGETEKRLRILLAHQPRGGVPPRRRRITPARSLQAPGWLSPHVAAVSLHSFALCSQGQTRELEEGQSPAKPDAKGWLLAIWVPQKPLRTETEFSEKRHRVPKCCLQAPGPQRPA